MLTSHSNAVDQLM